MAEPHHHTDPTFSSATGYDGGCEGETAGGSDRRTFLKDGLMAVAALTAVAGASVPLEAMTRTYAIGAAGAGLATLSYPIPTADGATIDRANKVILIRYQGMVYALSRECPHKGTMVDWQPEQNRLYCPKHKSTFTANGTKIQGKSPRSMDRYAIRLEGGKLVVDTATVIEGDGTNWATTGVKVG
ncbi:MAG: ubiquinol-cytochrome c reductase iron-sulfur subunit [Gemmatimonadota bacterium]